MLSSVGENAATSDSESSEEEASGESSEDDPAMEECSSKPNEETEAASQEKVNQNNKIEEDVLNELQEATNEKIEKIKSDIEEEEEFACTVRSVAWKTWWVPIAGQVGAVGLALRANAAESFAEQLEKQLSIENNHIIEMNTKDPAELAKSMEERVQKWKEALHADLEKEMSELQ